MKELTESQAIQFAKLHKARTLFNTHQKAYFQFNQKLLSMNFSEFHEAVEKTLEHPVWTHEFGIRTRADELKNKINQIVSIEDKDYVENIVSEFINNWTNQ